MGKRLTEARLRTIVERQCPPKWGVAYEPAIQVCTSEAPPISRPSVLNSRRLGRTVHVLSQPERHAALLALYHPGLRDLHEQRMLSPSQIEHPLTTYPGLMQVGLSYSRGTRASAEDLRCLGQHPWVWAADTGERIAFPYIGDFLLFLEDRDGLYCINWTVKKSAAGFDRSPIDIRAALIAEERGSQAVANRHRIEECYYQEFGIRTERVTGDAIPHSLACTLDQLFTWERRDDHLTPPQRAWLLSEARVLVVRGEVITAHIPRLQSELGCGPYDVLCAIYQGIWTRAIRVDLFSSICIDAPLEPERNDVLLHYADWFQR